MYANPNGDFDYCKLCDFGSTLKIECQFFFSVSRLRATGKPTTKAHGQDMSRQTAKGQRGCMITKWLGWYSKETWLV